MHYVNTKGLYVILTWRIFQNKCHFNTKPVRYFNMKAKTGISRFLDKVFTLLLCNKRSSCTTMNFQLFVGKICNYHHWHQMCNYHHAPTCGVLVTSHTALYVVYSSNLHRQKKYSKMSLNNKPYFVREFKWPTIWILC